MVLHSNLQTLGYSRKKVSRLADINYDVTDVTTGSTIGTYGANWVEFLNVSPMPFDVSAVRIVGGWDEYAAAARGDLTMIIAMGAAGQEVQIIGPLLWGGRQSYTTYTLPIYLARGTRVSLKVAGGQASRALGFGLELFGNSRTDPSTLPAKWVAYGVTVSSGVGAYGTSAVFAGTADTWSAWTNYATTTYAHDLWLPMVGAGSQTAMAQFACRPQWVIAPAADADLMITNATNRYQGILWSQTTTANDEASRWQGGVWAGAEHLSKFDIFKASRAAGQQLAVRWSANVAVPSANTITYGMLAAVR